PVRVEEPDGPTDEQGTVAIGGQDHRILGLHAALLPARHRCHACPPGAASARPYRDGYSILRRIFAGTPTAIENAGMSSVTTEFAPITQRSPTVTPLVMTTCAPHQTLSPIRVGPLLVKPCHGRGSVGSSKRWLASVTKQPLANMQWAPISTSSAAATMTPML